MKKLLTVLLLGMAFASFGQQGKFKPFILIVLKPDTAIIDKDLFGDIDSVQNDHLKSYYNSIRQLEKFANSNDYFPNDSSVKEQTKRQLVKVKAAESEVKNFKYYELISEYSTEVYQFYFNENEPNSIIVQLPKQTTSLEYLNKLADSVRADYIVFFKNIHTQIVDRAPLLKLTTSLYSKKDRKIILVKETEGDNLSRGDMWTCGSSTLSCLLINAVRTSTEQVTPVIAKRQLRH